MDLIIQNAFRLVIRNERFNLLLLIYILMNTVKNLTTICLQLNYRNVLEVAILSLTYLIKYVFETTQKI